jgi:putative flippase GtrA
MQARSQLVGRQTSRRQHVERRFLRQLLVLTLTRLAAPAWTEGVGIAQNATMVEARSTASLAQGLAQWLRNPVVRRQLVRFVIVGVGNTLISFVSYRLLLAVSVPYLAAAPVAWGAGAVNGYVFNRGWTFGARDSTGARVRYLAVQAAGALSTSLLVTGVVAAGIGKGEAYLAAVPPVTVLMFVANRFWTFADRARASLATARTNG